FSVCTDCGMIQDTDERHLPLTEFTYRTISSTRPTAMSRALAKYYVRAGHVHRWEFGQGGDYGFTRSCALGKGSHLLSAVNQKAVGAFVEGLAQYGDADVLDKWLKLLLDGDTSWQAASAITISGYPEDGFVDRNAFAIWYAANGEKLLREIEELSK